jgi:hypothetical protein
MLVVELGGQAQATLSLPADVSSLGVAVGDVGARAGAGGSQDGGGDGAGGGASVISNGTPVSATSTTAWLIVAAGGGGGGFGENRGRTASTPSTAPTAAPP